VKRRESPQKEVPFFSLKIYFAEFLQMQRYEFFWGKRESLTIIIKTDIGVWNIIRIFAGIFLNRVQEE
jgi:hypothetical protein